MKAVRAMHSTGRRSHLSWFQSARVAATVPRAVAPSKPRRRRWRLVVALAALAVASSTAVSPALAAGKPLPPGLGGREWSVIGTKHKVVALTFDAGANADGVASILSTLGSEHVPATFFLTGDFVGQFPAQARAIVAAGERVGDHSVSHPYFTKLTDAQMRYQVLHAQTQIVSVTRADPWPWFRFPYGDRNAHTISFVNSLGFAPVGWTVDTLGWKGTSGGSTVRSVVSRVLASLRPGEVVLMHCGSNPTDHTTLDASALPAVISGLRARGYSFVTLDALRGIGYVVASSNGDIGGFGAPLFGSDLGRLAAGVVPAGLAVDPVTGGYWVLKSDGGVDNFGAPWSGSLRGKLGAGVVVTAIGATPHGGYLVLTSDGGVRGFGAPLFGSDLGRLAAGVVPAGLAVDPVTGGYWVLKSDGGVDNFNAPWYGSLAGRLDAGQSVTAVAGE
jgi:peptidoglycan/xylan/chitin deacetylase (PgdA/CDA1 family)